MFLKALTLKGFKSFADATTMHLEPGVTVVVGPNGSGKSNVVDAIAWVLGAQAPSAVRSQKMDDVIFAGTAKRPPLGRAEVALTIDNSAGLLPIEFTEVTVSRTLFRTGDSEYAINGAPVRLLDVQELLSDAGVGRQQHVIVSQGQIDAVLNARPEERRAVIEEAAGVLKFRKRKEKAERRLDATEASLLRVQDLLREVRRQLRPLERQAEAARRYGELAAELAALQVFLAGREIAALRTRLTAGAGDRAAISARERELRTELVALDTEVLAAESELTARGDHDIGDEMVRVEHLRERARGIAAVIAERRRSLERDRGQLMDSGLVANLEADADRLRIELAEVHAALAAQGPLADALAADEDAFAARQATSLAGLDQAPSSKAASAAAEARGELRSLRQSADRAAAELRRITDRAAELTARIAALDDAVQRLRADCTASSASEAALVTEAEAAEARLAAAEQAYASAADEARRAEDELARWVARSEALQQALESARARAGAEHLAGVDGVLGTLLDLIEVDDGWEPAVEAALGEAVVAVVVDSPDAGRAALRSLAASDVHSAVLALGVARGGERSEHPDALRGRVRGLQHGVDALLDHLLAGAVRVDTWTAAVDHVLAHPGAVVATAAGDRFSPQGWRLGAAGGGATGAALDDARRHGDRAADALKVAAEAVALAEAERAAALAAIDDVTVRLDRHDATFGAASEGLARAQGERRDASVELAALTVDTGPARERVERDAARLAELEASIARLEADEAAEQHAARTQREARTALERAAGELAGRRKELEVRNAGLLERQAMLTARLEDDERRLRADVAARAIAHERRALVEGSLDALARLSAVVEGHRAVIEGRHGELVELRRKQSDEVRGIAQRLDACRRRRSDAERELDTVRERSRRAEVEEAETKLRLESTVEGLRREHDCEPAVAEAAVHPVVPEGTTAAAHLRQLERDLRQLGPINPLALEEFNELQERHAFLESQLDDVRETRRELLRVIKAVDLEIQSVFAAAFADVAGHFTTLFSSLFPGGTGGLLLTEPDDLLRTGIEVEAKPGGKNVKKLSLLSGGERSLTALAFLFAVFRSRPSPFYVMDEVEAALDDVNLHRFLALIHEFRQEAQLLIVSHQKRTMEAGDCLLGVTMQPGGSSKVVTERPS